MRNKIIGYSIGPIGSAALGVITLPLLTWIYPVDDIGRISMLQIMGNFLTLLFCLGLDQAFIREFDASEKKAKLFKQCLVPGAVLLLISLFIILLLGREWLSTWLYGATSDYLAIISILCFVLIFISRFLSLVVRMEDRAIAYSMSQLLPKLLFLILISCSVWLNLSNDIYNLVTLQFLSLLAVFLIFVWTTRHTWLASKSIKFDIKQNKSLLTFGLPLVVGGLASWGLNVMDKLFLRSMSTFEELGIYSVTVSVAAGATIISSIFNTLWAPMVYKWLNMGIDTRKIDEISEHVLAVIFFIIVLSGLFSWILPYLLPNSYASIRYLITLCLLGPLLYTLSETTAVGIAISRRTVFSMLASLGAMLVNAFGNYILVPEYGALGAATSTAISFFIFYVLRTEFSSIVWRKIPKARSYMTLLPLLLLSCLNGLFNEMQLQLIILWLISLAVGFILFRNSIKLMFKWLGKYLIN